MTDQSLPAAAVAAEPLRQTPSARAWARSSTRWAVSTISPSHRWAASTSGVLCMSSLSCVSSVLCVGDGLAVYEYRLIGEGWTTPSAALASGAVFAQNVGTQHLQSHQ